MNPILIICIVIVFIAIGVTLYLTVFRKHANPPRKNPPRPDPHPDPHTGQTMVFKISGDGCKYNDSYYQGKDETKYGLYTYYSKNANYVVKPFKDTESGNEMFNICKLSQACSDAQRREGYINIENDKPKAGDIHWPNQSTCTLTYL